MLKVGLLHHGGCFGSGRPIAEAEIARLPIHDGVGIEPFVVSHDRRAFAAAEAAVAGTQRKARQKNRVALSAHLLDRLRGEMPGFAQLGSQRQALGDELADRRIRRHEFDRQDRGIGGLEFDVGIESHELHQPGRGDAVGFFAAKQIILAELQFGEGTVDFGRRTLPCVGIRTRQVVEFAMFTDRRSGDRDLFGRSQQLQVPQRNSPEGVVQHGLRGMTSGRGELLGSQRFEESVGRVKVSRHSGKRRRARPGRTGTQAAPNIVARSGKDVADDILNLPFVLVVVHADAHVRQPKNACRIGTRPSLPHLCASIGHLVAAAFGQLQGGRKIDRIVHGCHDDTFLVAGYVAEVVRRSLRYVFNIGPDAKSLVNGFEVDRGCRLAEGDVVEFVRPWGRKGGEPDQENDFDYITLAEASKLIPERTPGRKVSLDSICRWCQRGIRGIRLRSVLISGRRFTTRKWLADFIEASQKSESECPTDAVPRTAKQLNQAADDASRQLRSVWKNYRRQR